MPPEPLYCAADLHPAYQLRYSWAGWPSQAPFATDVLADALPSVAPEWERDGVRVLESLLTAERIQLTLSTTPQVAPVTLAARVKGRLQHHVRRRGMPVDFSRKLAVRSLGDPTRGEVEQYIRSQVANEALADERYREHAYIVVDPSVDLSLPTESNSGRYWYNLHLVLVTQGRYRIGAEDFLARVRDTVPRICAKKGYAASTWAVLPDHVHLSLRGDIARSPEEIALAFLNNLAYAVGQRPMWQAGYYAGTFGEYGMGAVRPRGG